MAKEDIYKMTEEEEKIFKKYQLANKNAVSLSQDEKWTLIKAVNTSCGLDYRVDGVGLLKTRQKTGKGDQTSYVDVETLYAPRGACNQLARVHKISCVITERKITDGLAIFGARATGPDGRSMDATGVCNLTGQSGDYLANKLMHAETKAQRRAILNYAGLGYLDETEAMDIPNAEHVELPEPAKVKTTTKEKPAAEEKKPAATSGAATTPKQEQTSVPSAGSQKSSESATPAQTSSSAVDPNAFCGEERAAQFVQSAKLVWEQKELTKKMFETYGVRWGAKDHACAPGECRHTTFTNAKWEQAMNEVAQELAKRAKQ